MAIVAGLRKHLGASLEDYQDQYVKILFLRPPTGSDLSKNPEKSG